ncbi:MAG: hypothetical protein IPN63_09500 [Gammaproteobacteria bacterium]|nr:hypothetical protein [Gammaproteobacteria bacterium]MBK9427602.1 hypothetical protein [Gammaproteobacteria bacterium]
MMGSPPRRFDLDRTALTLSRARQAAMLWLVLCAGLAAAGQGHATADLPQLPAVKSPLASRALLTDSARAGERIVAVGAHGNIVYSDDGGSHWQQADRVPTQVLLTSVYFVDDRRGWAAGHDSLILRTTDGGLTWETVYENRIPDGDVPKPILGLYFSDPLHGIAVGAFSLLLITADGGTHWQEIDVGPLRALLSAAGQEPEPNLNAIAPLADGFLIVGELGTLLHYRPYTDSEPDPEPATRWRILDSPYGGSYFGIESSAPDDLLIYGLRGHCYRSRDSGQTWFEVTTDTTANLYDLLRLDNGDLIAVGAGGFIARLPHDGTAAERLPYAGFDGLVSMQRAATDRLLLFGEAGVRDFSLPETP